MHKSRFAAVVCVCLVATAPTGALVGELDDPYADVMVEYVQGSNPTIPYTNASVTIGSPERYTGEDVFPSVVSPFSPPYGVDEIVSIGGGGHLIVQFHTPVTDDPNNLYGIDLIIFGNTGLTDDGGNIGPIFSDDGGIVEVSADGETWETVKGAFADGLWPGLGYLDAGPYGEPGSLPTDFTRPVDPLLTFNDVEGMSYADLMTLYRGSGGGTGVDISSTGLNAISYVRVSVVQGGASVEIDGFSDASPRTPGDVNLDGLVNVDDLLLVIGRWGVPIPGGPPADFDLNGAVDVDDLLTVINNWS